jgi:hypothetical protein
MVNMEGRESQVMMGHQGLEAYLEMRDCQALKVLVVHRGPLVIKVLLVHQVKLETMEKLDNQE